MATRERISWDTKRNNYLLPVSTLLDRHLFQWAHSPQNLISEFVAFAAERPLSFEREEIAFSTSPSFNLRPGSI